MIQKIHNAQLEVWEWKDSLYKELKSVPRENWAKYLNDLADDTMKLFIEKKEKEKQLTPS